MNEQFKVYADLEHPVAENPVKANLVKYNGLLYKSAIIRGTNVAPMPPGWKLITVVRKKIQGRLASVLELISIDS